MPEHPSVAASVIDEAQRTPSEVIDAGARLARRLLDEHSQIVSRLAAALVATQGERDIDKPLFLELLRDKDAGVPA